MIQLDPKMVNLIALYTGGKGQENCICKCPCCSQKGPIDTYQGSLKQIDEVLDIFPNLRQLYFLGNPDPAVDTEFCNQAALMTIDRGVNVSFSTSGVGGLKMLRKLLANIKPENVDYISFSIDSAIPEKMSMLKGINYPWKNALEGIDWAIKEGFIVKIQPTLWSSNYQDAYSIIDFFSSRGVKLFSFHIGSVEKANIMTHQHLTPAQVQEVHQQINNITKKYPVHVTCPIIYPSCGENDLNKWYCMNPLNCYNWLVFLKENGIWGTHIPIASEFDEKYSFKLESNKTIDFAEFERNDSCPFSEKTAHGSKTLCRYIAKTWN